MRFQNSDLILIAACSGMGKTAFMLSMAQFMAMGEKKNVAFFSLECSRQQRVSENARSLKNLARELNIPIIVNSYVSWHVGNRADPRPVLRDLYMHGYTYERDADVVIFLYRDDYYNEDSNEKNIAEVTIAKNRTGPLGTFKLVWMPDHLEPQGFDL